MSDFHKMLTAGAGTHWTSIEVQNDSHKAALFLNACIAEIVNLQSDIKMLKKVIELLEAISKLRDKVEENYRCKP